MLSTLHDCSAEQVVLQERFSSSPSVPAVSQQQLSPVSPGHLCIVSQGSCHMLQLLFSASGHAYQEALQQCTSSVPCSSARIDRRCMHVAKHPYMPKPPDQQLTDTPWVILCLLCCTGQA